ncbi:MAG TPA: hypothetical protein DD725_08235 [Deltaproteobacteria bacterium]|nr:hypothetical protein [Deltaproteobacteria bacterium]
MGVRLFYLDEKNGKRNQLITVKELSEVLSVKESTLYQWAELGQIPSIKLNGSLRFDLSDVEKWIQSCKKPVISDYNPLIKLEARKGEKNK